MSVLGRAATDAALSGDDVAQIIAAAGDATAPDGKRVLVLLPDHTRTCPLGLIVRGLHAALSPRAAQVDYLVALGTHPALRDDQIDALLEIPPGRRGDVLGGSRVFNHRWNDAGALTTLGTLTADEVARIAGPDLE